jgi:hypothetical protein
VSQPLRPAEDWGVYNTLKRSWWAHVAFTEVEARNRASGLNERLGPFLAHLKRYEARRAQDIGKRLRATAEALARYGEHDGDCAASAVGAPGDARCTCGYDDAVANGLPPLRPRTG